MTLTLPSIVEHVRHPSPTITPQALAWHNGALWIGSRDLSRIYGIDPKTWKVFEEREAPGIPWSAVSTGDDLRFTIGEGADDDRYLWTYRPGNGFSDDGRFAYPDLTGSYLSYDGANVYLSQWYKGKIMKLGLGGEILRTIEVGPEISGHVFVNGSIYVLRGTEQDGERWTIAQFNPSEVKPDVQELAVVPFACRSLAFDGKYFWSNFRAGNETISFSLPE
ncbi:MAG TPA: hypothetical protein VGM62_05020 [Chthoniobacterales bacterium]|jgi:hypothetical protein